LNKLYRSKKTKIVAGVAGGLAEYFDVDVTLVRLLWVLSVFVGGAGIPAYIIAIIIIPEEKAFSSERPDTSAEFKANSIESRDKTRRNAGLLLIGIGIFFLAYEVLPREIMRFSWPLVLIAIGFYILFRDRGRVER